MEKRLLQVQGLVAIADGPAEDATNDVAPTFVARHHAVGNGEGDGPDVIGDHAEGNAHLLVLVRIVDLEVVVPTHLVAGREVGDGLQQRGEEVRIVRGLLSLQHGHHSLKAHPGVHVLVVEGLQIAVRLRIVLDEDQIPQLHDLRMILVHQGPPRRLPARLRRPQVHMDLGARPTRPGVPHHPEVFLGGLVQDPLVGQRRLRKPQVVRLLVGRYSELVVPFVHRRVEPVRIQAPPFHQQLPSPRNGLGLEVVAKAPVAQHLEEGVMVGVMPHLLQVVVLTGDPQALLGVHGPRVGPLAGSQEDILELIHAGVREEKGAVSFRHEGRAGDLLVALLPKELQKLLPDFLGRTRRIGGGLEMRIHRRSRRSIDDREIERKDLQATELSRVT